MVGGGKIVNVNHHGFEAIVVHFCPRQVNLFWTFSLLPGLDEGSEGSQSSIRLSKAHT